MQMITWVILPVLCVIAVAVYLYRKVKAAVKCFLPAYSLKRQRIFAGIISLLLIIPAVRIYGMWFIILLHFTVFLLLLDAVVFLIKKLKKQNQLTGLWNKIYRSGVIAILLTAVLIGYGRYNIFHVVRTEYNIQTQKNIREEGYRIVLLSDLHYGVSMNDNNLQDVVNRISAEQADIVVLDGDIVDENTTSEQMQSAFRILGQADSTYGVYYVYGNHDKNNYAAKPNYSAEKMEDTITQAGDRGGRNAKRKDISSLVKELNPEQEWIVLDHQPSEYKKAENTGCDMILSGHTHAGQIWPVGLFASLFHFDELNYGEQKQGNLDAIVTSGIAGWGYPIRTEKHSEYVVVNLIS